MNIVEELSFLDKKPRMKALFLILFRAEGYLTSIELGKYLNVTSRTIKNDIKQLKEDISNDKILLISKRSLGYKLIVTKEEYQNDIREFYQLQSSTTVESDFDFRVSYIIRWMLSSNMPLKTESIKKKLNINFSINKELQKIKEILSQYDLTLISRPYHGMSVEGEEFKKVLLSVRMYKYFDKNTINDFGITEYNVLFSCDNNERKRIRQVFLKTLINSRIVFSDINAERFLIFLIYFRNKCLNNLIFSLELPEINFQYRNTDEYKLVEEVIHKLRNQFKGFNFTDEVVQFLTYISIFSTDLYRFVDCTKEKYNTLIEVAEETRNFLLREMSLCIHIDTFDDYTSLKDLLKIMIPISLKIMLNVSDSIDLRYSDFKNNGYQLVLRFYIRTVYEKFYKKYNYQFSDREKYLIFLVFCGILNRINLDHKKLKVAIIAIDGRLSTQQTKFHILHYFSDFIDTIDTRVLYELDCKENSSYDLYVCSAYGKNLNIRYYPICYLEEGKEELYYINTLKYLFYQAYEYEKRLPKFNFETRSIKAKKRNNNSLQLKTYDYIDLGSEIHLYLNLNSNKEAFKIIKLINHEALSKTYNLIIDIHIGEDKQKLKMFFNIIQNIKNKPNKLEMLSEEETSYSYFLM